MFVVFLDNTQTFGGFGSEQPSSLFVTLVYVFSVGLVLNLALFSLHIFVDIKPPVPSSSSYLFVVSCYNQIFTLDSLLVRAIYCICLHVSFSVIYS